MLDDVQNVAHLSQEDRDRFYQRCHKEFDDILSSPDGAEVNLAQQNISSSIPTPLLNRMVVGGYGSDRYFPLYQIEKLITRGADVNLVSNWTTPLQAAIGGEYACRAEVVELLLQKGANPNVFDAFHYSPLHDAIFGGHTEVLQMLLDHAANVNYVRPIVEAWRSEGVDGWTPLHYAVKRSKIDIVQILIEYGADRTAKDATGKTPRDLALELNRTDILPSL